MSLLVDATTAQHTRGIATVAQGILGELRHVAPPDTVVSGGPDLVGSAGLRVRRLRVAQSRAGRLAYQRLLLPLDLAQLRLRGQPVERALFLDSYAPLVRLDPRVRYAAYVHDMLVTTHPEYWGRVSRLVKAAAFATLRQGRVRLFTSTAFNAAEIQRALGVPAHVAPYGCGQLGDAEADDLRAQPLAKRDRSLAYVGAFEPRKNIFLLLDAFERAASTADDVTLALAGGGRREFVATVEKRIARSPHGDRIRIVSNPDRQTVLDLVRRAGALVYPALAEGFGLPILEALALGSPVVASDIPAIRSWAGDAILYGPPARPDGWVIPILDALAASDDRRRAGQALTTAFRWRSCAASVVDF